MTENRLIGKISFRYVMLTLFNFSRKEFETIDLVVCVYIHAKFLVDTFVGLSTFITPNVLNFSFEFLSHFDV